MLVIVFAPKEIFTSDSCDSLIDSIKIERGATGKILKKISLFVSFIELILFVQYDFYWMATVWVSAEIAGLALNKRYDKILSEKSTQSN